MVKLFISHYEGDRILVDELLLLLQEIFDADVDGDLRISSNILHGLPPGSTPSDVIRNDIPGSYVIGVVTPRSVARAWVVSELAAAWVAAKRTSLVLAGGAEHDDIEGPLKGVVCLYAEKQSDVCKLILDLIRLKIFSVRDAQLQRGLERNSYDQGSLEKVLDKYVDVISKFVDKASKFGPYHKDNNFIGTRREVIFERKRRLRLSWKDICDDARKEIIISGWSCNNTINAGNEQFFRQALRRGVQVSILIQDYRGFEAAQGIQFGSICGKDTSAEVVQDIRLAEHNFIEKFKEMNGHGYAGRIRLIRTGSLMCWSSVSKDLEGDDAMIQLESYYNSQQEPLEDDRAPRLGNLGAINLDDRLNIVLRPENPFFSNFRDSIRYLLATATVVVG